MSQQRAGRQRAGRWALGALGWVATGVGVIAIILVLGAQSSDALPDALRPALGVALGAGVVISVLLAVVYVVARARNRRSDSSGGSLPDSPRTRAVQRVAGSILDRLDSSAERDNAVRRILLTDSVQLTAAALEDAGLDDLDPDTRWDALSFIWTVRPSQAADFADSPQFHRLPRWAQDAVVLLDLRRDLRLRGAVALGGGPGFYAHPVEQAIAAAARTGNTELAGALTAAVRGTTDDVQRVIDLLDDDAVWSRVVDTAG